MSVYFDAPCGMMCLVFTFMFLWMNLGFPRTLASDLALVSTAKEHACMLPLILWSSWVSSFCGMSVFVTSSKTVYLLSLVAQSAAAFDLLSRVESVLLFRDLVGLLSGCVDLLGDI